MTFSTPSTQQVIKSSIFGITNTILEIQNKFIISFPLKNEAFTKKKNVFCRPMNKELREGRIKWYAVSSA